MICLLKVLNITWGEFITEVINEPDVHLKSSIESESIDSETKYVHDKYIIFAS